MSSSVDQIKSKIDIVTLVGSYINLERAGTNFKARCPFHNEKTPSFYVSPDRGNYYCFGCHAKGDVFTFVQEFEGVDFLGSLKMLAERAGVTLDNTERTDKSEKERLFGILELAVFFFEKNLSENPTPREYLENRGVTDETIKNFRIGFALAEWRTLYDFLKSKNVSDTDMLLAGLIKKKDTTTANNSDGNIYYDTFRGRIMFPIADSLGRVCGFSGRILISDDKSPKYLNSPETEVFNKSEILFGFDKAKNSIRLKDYSVLVEGQMDLVMLHQAGITNTVASSGTALTTEHLTKLQRLSPRIIMAYDGDGAGFTATDRSAKLALSLGMELKIAEMPQGKDPADLAKENKDKLVEVVRESKHIIDFYTDVLIARGLSGRDLGQEIKIHVLPYIAMLVSSIEKAHFIKSISQKLFIKEDALWEDLKKVNVAHVQADVRSTPPKPSFDSIEKKILGIIMWQESLATPSVNVETIKKKAKEILKEKYVELETHLKKDTESLLFEIESQYNSKEYTPEYIRKEIEELLVRLEEDSLKKQLTDMMTLLQKAEQLRDSREILKYLEECQRISNQIHILKQVKSHTERSKHF